MFQKKALVAFLLVCVMLLAAACAAPAASPASNPTAAPAKTEEKKDEPADAAEEEAAPVEKVKLKLYEQPKDDDPESSFTLFDAHKAIIEEKFPNFEIEWTRMAPGTDYRQQYDQLVMTGDGPTVGHMFPYVDIKTRMANGTIGELTQFVTGWDLKAQGLVTETFDQAISSPDGKWYAVPYAPYVNGIVYNKAAIVEAGGDADRIPTTWSEFGEMAQAYTDKDIPRFGYLLLGSDWNAWTFTPWVWSAGGEMVRENDDGTWAVAFNEDAGVHAAMYMNELIWKYGATQKDVLQSYDDMQNHFKAGQAAYGWGSPPGFSADDLARFDQVQEDIGFFALPGKDEGGRQVAFAGGEVWTVLPNLTQEQLEASWEYLVYCSFNEEYLIPRWELEDSLERLTANPAVRTDLVEKKYSMASAWPSHWAKQMADAMAVAQPEPYCPNWNELKNEIVKPLQEIYLTEGITFEKAKELLDACAETLYTTYPDSFTKP